MRVGLNLTGVINWQSGQPFRNALKVACWASSRGGVAVPFFPNLYPAYYPATAGLEGHPLAVDSQGVAIPVPTWDSDGYLTNGTGQSRYNDQTIYYSTPGLPPGTYNLRADGDGDWTFTGVAAGGGAPFTASGSFTNRHVATFSFPVGLEQPQLKLTRTNPADHVRNMQLMLPGYGFDDPLFLNDEFIASLSGFSCIRLMDWMSTNGDEVSEWSQRMPATAQGFGGDNPHGGIPYETFGEIARRTGADIWINIPRRASNDWIARFGAMMLATLPTTTNLYVEYGNELWNGYTFQTALDNQSEAVATGLYDPTLTVFEIANRYAARRSRQTSMLMKRAFGASAGRVRDVFATMGAGTLEWGLHEWVNYGVDPGVTTRPTAPLATRNAPPYSGAVSSYMGSALGDPINIEVTKAGGIDGIMARLNGDLLSTATATGSAVADICASYGTIPAVYEGGFENFNQANLGISNSAPPGQPSNALPPDPVMTQLSIDASRDVRIGPAAAHELHVMANFYSLFMWFSHMSIPTGGGQYGLVESTFGDGPLAGAGSHASTWPKWAAVNGLAAAGNVTPLPPPPPPFTVASLSLSSSIASDRSTLTGTVAISAVAPAGGLVVAITVDQPIVVPAHVTIPAGATTAQFSLVVGDLTVAATATVRAAYSYSSTTATLSLSPYIAPYALIPGHALAAGLEVLYLCAEQTGTVVHDFSGHARHVAISPGHWLTAPNLGAIAMDATYTLYTTLPLLPKYPLTLAVASTMPPGSNTMLASLLDDAGHNFTVIRNDFGTDVDALLDDAAMSLVISSRKTVEAATWHTFVMVIEATRLTLYVDGVVVGTPSTLPAPPTGRVAVLCLGGLGDNYRVTTTLSVAALASRAWSAAEAVAFAAGPTSMVAAAAAPVLPPLPAAPTGLTATAGDGQISISATPVAGATSYNLYRALAPGGEPTTPAATGIVAFPLVDRDCVNNVLYHYELAAVNAAGEGPRSAEVAATPRIAVVVPPASRYRSLPWLIRRRRP